GNVNWNPLIYQFRNISFEEIVALYRSCDVALVSPIRDGMNLVAKEFVASRPDGRGVLILSEIAGAAKEMGEALIINPVHTEDFARALELALSMPDEEQMRRNAILQDRLRRYDVNRWANDFVQATLSMQNTDVARRARLLTGKALAALIQQYRSSKQRALLLDYDGTLVPFASDPKFAQPDTELMDLLTALANDTANRLVIISGRGRRDLEQWFGRLPVSLVAEHGVWTRRDGNEWRLFKTMSSEWKERVRPILQLFVDRLPGAMLEEKEYSLAWHFRQADPDQASQRAKELLDDLSGYTRNIDIQVLEGNKVIEIRNTGVNKGTAAMEWLNGGNPDFVLGIGDDWTDEDMFRALPESAHSVRVGMAATAARYYLGSHAAVRRTLREMIAG
ncbi:MAG: trehalose-phosphatase, partial [Limisphaerales bacterium]